MKKNSLSNQGLSLSAAQSISNMCFQRAMNIEQELNKAKNFTKSVKVNNVGNNMLFEDGSPLPKNVIDLLREKSKLHACQAFLVENIKAKNDLIINTKKEQPDYSEVPEIEEPEYTQITTIQSVDENFGWGQLTESEINEFYEAEAFAAHIGKFIHENGKLSQLRQGLSDLPSYEWIEVTTGVKSLVTINKLHSEKELNDLHEELAKEHVKFESRVNYFKAKVKNLTTEENARIAKLNADNNTNAAKINLDLRNEYYKQLSDRNSKMKEISNEFEIKRQDKIKEYAALKIKVDGRFQDIINTFSVNIKDK
jgi:hypothetical protein